LHAFQKISTSKVLSDVFPNNDRRLKAIADIESFPRYTMELELALADLDGATSHEAMKTSTLPGIVSKTADLACAHLAHVPGICDKIQAFVRDNDNVQSSFVIGLIRNKVSAMVGDVFTPVVQRLEKVSRIVLDNSISEENAKMIKEFEITPEEADAMNASADKLSDDMLRKEIAFIVAWSKVRKVALEAASYIEGQKLDSDAENLWASLSSELSILEHYVGDGNAEGLFQQRDDCVINVFAGKFDMPADAKTVVDSVRAIYLAGGPPLSPSAWICFQLSLTSQLILLARSLPFREGRGQCFQS
jgi:hypothetical protein